MPFESEAQRRFFRLASVAPGRLRKKAPPPSVVARFIREDPGGKLPKKKRKKAA